MFHLPVRDAGRHLTWWSSVSFGLASTVWLLYEQRLQAMAAFTHTTSNHLLLFFFLLLPPFPHLKQKKALEKGGTKTRSVREARLPWSSSVASDGLAWRSTHTNKHTPAHTGGGDVKAQILSDPLFTIGSPTPRLNVIPTLDITRLSPSPSQTLTLCHVRKYTNGKTQNVCV